MRRIQVCALALMLLLLPAAGHAEQLLPFVAIRDDIPSAWHQTFDTVNGPVTIDTDILLPDRDTIPVAALAFHTFPEDALADAFPQAQTEADSLRTMVQAGDFAACIYPELASRCGWLPWPAGAEYAENAAISRDALSERAAQLLSRLPLPEGMAYRPAGIVAHGRTWLVDQHDTPVRPLNDHGYYDLYLQTTVLGIPVADAFCFDQDDAKCHGPHTEQPQLHYYDDEHFTLCLSGYRVVEVLREDAPMLPFSSIAQEIGRLVASGHLRAVYRMALCCVPMWSDDGQGIVAVPAWVLWGEYCEDPSAPGQQEPPDFYQTILGGYTVVIPAQTGKALDHAEAGMDRWLASTYLTEPGGR